ncbi:COX15/CtaA family protein [Vicingaceae bacterium]|nr:COX15/CtaA family protein [Vicingaceae bacterium]
METTTKQNEQLFSKLPHRVAVCLAFVVFPLIWVGGLVTTSDAGMAVPDWPNTYNYNMFAYPIRDWFLGPWDLFVEHGHRLLGSLAGIVAIALVAVTYWKDKRKWLRILAIMVLVTVIFQGLLGGFRVVLDQRAIAQIHGSFGPAFFAFVATMCVFTSRWWLNPREKSPLVEITAGTSMIRSSVVLLVLSYSQLLLGAAIRHLPDMAHPSTFKMLVVLHIVMAIMVLLCALFVVIKAQSGSLVGCGVRGTARLLALLVLAQFMLGLATWIVKFGWPAMLNNQEFAARFVVTEKSFWQMNLVTAHVAVGSLVVAISAVHAVRCIRSLSIRNEDAPVDLGASTAKGTSA